MALDTNTLKNRATGVMAGFTPGQRVVVIVALMALVGGGVFFSQWVSKPSMAPLYSNLSADDASAITTKLQSEGVKYELTNGGNTIMVPESKVYQARIDMAGQGLPAGDAQGYSLLDKQGITTSEFTQQVDYQRAMEGELAKTIDAIDGVKASTVHLVIPNNDVFTDNASKPSASVLVQMDPGKTISNEQVQAVVNLVAGAVEDMDPGNVTVADDKGRVLAAPGSNSDSAAANDSNNDATTAAENDLTTKIQNLLTPIVGAGHVVVTSEVQMNFDQSSTTSEIFDPNNKPATPSSSHTITETFVGQDPNGGSTGVLGTGGSDSATGTGATGTSTTGTSQDGNYSKTDASADYNNTDREVTQTKKTTPTVERESVAVLLDSSVAGVDPTVIQNAVTNGAGLQVARGDTITVSRVAFDQSTANQDKTDLAQAAKAKSSAQTMNLIKTALTFLLIVIILGVLFFLTRKRAKSYSGAMPISLAELGAAMPMEALPSADDLLDTLPPPDNSPESKERAKVDREITDLIEKQPDEVASLLRNWLADRRS